MSGIQAAAAAAMPAASGTMSVSATSGAAGDISVQGQSLAPGGGISEFSMSAEGVGRQDVFNAALIALLLSGGDDDKKQDGFLSLAMGLALLGAAAGTSSFSFSYSSGGTVPDVGEAYAATANSGGGTGAAVNAQA